ncbi:MAG: PHP domain-containing protein [Ruminococcaceae bacterium]|nr:PHP domain-containing protein [Oscillospiraceae bacterium]
MKLYAYGGVCSECPENTYPALLSAIKQGYDAICAEVGITQDGIPVLIPKDTDVSKYTLNELRSLDVGASFSPKFKGISVMMLEDAVRLVKDAGKELSIYIESSLAEKICEFLSDCDADISISCNDADALDKIYSKLPMVKLSYVGQAIPQNIPAEQLTVWVNIFELNEKTAHAVKSTGAKLGVMLCKEYSELEKAEKLGADALATRGQIKPIKNRGVLADMHTHSQNSHDAKFPVCEMCDAEMAAGVKIMAVTDHCDVFMCCDDNDLDIYSNLVCSYNETRDSQKSVGDGCRLLTGVEIGEGFWFPEHTKKVLGLVEYDVVVGSVHAVKSRLTEGKTGMQRAFSQIAWQDVSEKEIGEFFDLYFDDVLRCVSEQDIDIMAHLGCVKGYILRKKGLNFDLHPYEAKIRRILETIIRRGIAMEISASPKKDLGIIYPDEWIIKTYREMGGYLITVSTDAHHPKKAGENLRETAEMLKEMGFRNIFYFENRICHQCTL